MVKLGGLQRFSTIDFPRKLSAVVFTVGCNFRCPFCHNPDLVLGKGDEISENSVLSFLRSRIGQLEGVVISGGEPTLYADLPAFIARIKSLGFRVKLDSNGTAPNMLSQLINDQLLDFVAMDIKHIWGKYHEATNVSIVEENLKKSVQIIMSSGVDY